MTVMGVVFWACVGLIVYAHAGYPLLLWLLARPKRNTCLRSPVSESPSVTLIIAAYNEEDVIARKVANARALAYDGDLEIVVACDGSADATAERARAAGADLVLELPRGGKVCTQDAAVERASGEIVAFSDANALLAPDALENLVRPFRDPRVGYVCGQVRFLRPDGSNQEGLYWRYEMAVRALESRLGGVTGGNGALYATRREAYVVVDPRMGHDLSFPFNMVKRGWRALYEPSARAEEKMVPSIEGEFQRKRRMMSHTWPIVLRGGMLSPRGYGLLYGAMIVSHRLLRYALPGLHVVALAANLALVASHAGAVYVVTAALQAAFLVAAALAGVVRARPLLLARYYVLTAASPAAGLWDWLRHGTSATWEAAEGTR